MTDAKPSKSEKKRQYHELQELGEKLIELTDAQLNSIDTDDRLLDQVRKAKKLNAHGALRRQKQLIGKLMRTVDDAPIRSALALFGRSAQVDKAAFRDAERWRDRLAEEGSSALADFFDGRNLPDDALRALLASLASAKDADTQKQVRKKIFREVHQILLSDVHGLQD